MAEQATNQEKGIKMHFLREKPWRRVCIGRPSNYLLMVKELMETQQSRVLFVKEVLEGVYV